MVGANKISDPELRAVHLREARLADGAATDKARQIVMIDNGLVAVAGQIASAERDLQRAGRELADERSN